MIKFEIKNIETGKTESYEKECITLGEAEAFYELQESIGEVYDKARVKAENEIEKEHGKTKDFVSSELYSQLFERKYMKNLDARKIRKLSRDYFVSLFASQGLTEDDVLNSMGTKLYDRISNEIFREISGEDEDTDKNEKEEMGKSEEQSQ